MSIFSKHTDAAGIVWLRSGGDAAVDYDSAGSDDGRDRRAGHRRLQRADTDHQDLAKQQEQNKILTVQLDQANTRIADIKSKVEITTQRMGLTQSELAQAKSRAEAIRKEQQTSDQKLTEEITQVQKESNEKIGAVATEVGGAKKDIEATKTDLEATKGKLDRSLGDMNVMSGLIAHNKDDLDELRRRGDRN